MGTFAEDFRFLSSFFPESPLAHDLTIFFSEIYRTSIVERICVVNDEIFSNISVIFGGCTSIFIGHQPEFGIILFYFILFSYYFFDFSVLGIPCFKNSQCDFLQDSDGYCDLKAKKSLFCFSKNSFLLFIFSFLDVLLIQLIKKMDSCSV